MRTALVAVAAVFLTAHLALLPPTLDDVDGVNFALGVREFDVARHQPHPPGYPIFIALAKVSTGVLRLAGVPAPEARGLAVWGAVSGAALVLVMFALFRAAGADDAVAAAGATIAATAPLYWFTAARPLSDMAGLAAAAAAQSLLVAVACRRAGLRALLAGALVAGLAIGLRSQTFVLTLPLLGLVLVMPGLAMRAPGRIAAIAAVSLGIVAWGVPLIVESGGLTEYAVALGSQAGEDFEGVEMVWRMPGPRVLARALAYTFLWPWGTVLVGSVMVALAAVGALAVLSRNPRALVVMAVAFGPYAIFHLLFQEFVTVRYALPFVIPVAYLSAAALDLMGRRVLMAGVAALVTISLAQTIGPSVRYARHASPAFALLHDVERRSALSSDEGPSGRDGWPGGGREAPALAFHGALRRPVDWEAPRLPGPLLKAPHGREWLTLVSAIRDRPDRPVAYAADARRTDLSLFDPQRRQLLGSYDWSFREMPFVGGARPGRAELHLIHAPGWMLDRGWSLTAEVAGITARDALGPHVAPSIAWVRRRGEETLLVIGGRHLGTSADPAVRVTLALEGRAIASFEAPAGPFFHQLPLAAGSLQGSDEYLPVDVTSEAADGSNRQVPVALEQFDLQSPGVPMLGFDRGWNEPEYNPRTARSWRWMPEVAALWVRPIGRDVTLTLTGESPLRYFDRASSVTITLAGQEIQRLSLGADFMASIVLPAAQLAEAGGRVEIRSDQSFVPAERDGSADRRRLSLRIYGAAAR